MFDDDFLLYYEKKGVISDVKIADILKSDNRRYMVVAEPGYGKTRFLKELVLSHKNSYFIDAKKITNSIEDKLKECKNIDISINEKELLKSRFFKNSDLEELVLDKSTIVCIDALDEVAFKNLSKLFEKIEQFSNDYQDVKLILSCRTHHLKKMSFDYQSFDFKFLTLIRFNFTQIKRFLESRLDNMVDLKEIVHKSKMSNLMDFISTPRYLYYFSELLKEGSLEEIVQLSRKEMFEHFIYRKLEKELKDDIPQSQIDILKRVLEKLALIMKINNSSDLTKDELTTVFDQIDSSFGHIIFRDDLINQLYERSLLKDNVDTIEFENKEFLDYLSAKELARLSNIEQVLFDIAIEPNLDEIYPTWFDVLPFLFEFNTSVLEIFLDFIARKSHQVLDDEYFYAIAKIEPNALDDELRSKIFDLIFEYYTKHNKWFYTWGNDITPSLARHYKPIKHDKILESIDGRKYKNYLYVRRINAIKLIEKLIEYGKLDNYQVKDWQKKATKWLKLESEENQYLQENIVSSLPVLANGDFEWIKSLYFIFENGVGVQNAYARACFEVAPNDMFSVDVYLKTEEFRQKNKINNDFRFEYDYILQLSDVKAIVYAIDKLVEDNRHIELCEKMEEYIDGDKIADKFRKNLIKIYNKELSTFLKKLILKSINETYWHNCLKFYEIVIDVLLENESEYLINLAKELHSKYPENLWIYRNVNVYLYSHVKIENFDIFIKALDVYKEEKEEMIVALYYDTSSNEVKEKIKALYPKQVEEQQKQIDNNHNDDLKKIKLACEKFVKEIDNKDISHRLLMDYIEFKKFYIQCPNYMEKMSKLTKEYLQSNNPLDKKCNSLFIEFVKIAFDEKLKLTQEMKDNVFRYLPFCYHNNEDEIVLKVSKSPSNQAVKDVLKSYSENDSRFSISNLISFYQKTSMKEVEPFLLDMLEDNKIKEYEKINIINALSKVILTIEFIENHMKNLDKNSSLYESYLAILINKYQDKKAINKAFEWVKNRANIIREDNMFDSSLEKVDNLVAVALTYTIYSIEKDKELLLDASDLSKNGKKSGANFLRKIVYEHLKHLIDKESKLAFKYLDYIEKVIQENFDKSGMHWFESQLKELKQYYLARVSKDKNIAGSVRKYNQLQKNDYLDIYSIEQLKEIAKDIFEEEIRRWIEYEGAYKYINELAQKANKKNAEDLIQKTILGRMKLALSERDFRKIDYSIKREEQQLDNERLDFTLSYGFVGSIMIELKLSHNQEAKKGKKGKEYISKLKKYMSGTNSKYGLFIIFNTEETEDKFKETISNLKQLYKDEHEITILGIDCKV